MIRLKVIMTIIIINTIILATHTLLSYPASDSAHFSTGCQNMPFYYFTGFTELTIMGKWLAKKQLNPSSHFNKAPVSDGYTVYGHRI